MAATGLPVDGGSTRGYMVIGLLAAALGVQNATVRRLAVPDLTTTVLTLTLTGLAADFRLAGPGPQVGRRLAAVGADGRRRTIRPAPGGWWGAEAGGKQ